ncbi:hypothetical protein SARC_16220, partial [Sphaeroforma arctica JP610]
DERAAKLGAMVKSALVGICRMEYTSITSLRASDGRWCGDGQLTRSVSEAVDTGFAPIMG